MKNKGLAIIFSPLSKKYSTISGLSPHKFPDTTSLTRINYEFLKRNPNTLCELKLPPEFSFSINQEILKYLKFRQNGKLINIKNVDIENFDSIFQKEIRKFPKLLNEFSIARKSSIILCTGLNIPFYQDYFCHKPYIDFSTEIHPFGINHHNLFGATLIQNLNGKFIKPQSDNIQKSDFPDAIQIINPSEKYANISGTYDSSLTKLDYHCDGWSDKYDILDKIGLIGIVGHEKAITRVIAIGQIFEYMMHNNLSDILKRLSENYRYFSNTYLDEIIDMGLIINKDSKAPSRDPYLNARIRFSSYGHISDSLRSPLIADDALKLSEILNKINPVLETCLNSGMVLLINNRSNLHSRTAFNPYEANFKELTSGKVEKGQASNLFKDSIFLRTIGRANII